jgi:MYXO-CTERM domain-containing protein
MNKTLAISAIAAGTFAAPALAQTTLLTFSYSDLSAGFNNTSRVFSANAVATPGGLQSGGDVSRVDTVPNQTATFTTGFRSLATAGNVNITMNVAPTPVGNTIAASGTFTLTDDDNDTISGTFSGQWTDIGAGFDSFSGLVGAASITPAGAGDNLNFNGAPFAPGNMFSYLGLPLSGLSGAIVELQLTPGIFFNANFSNVSSQASGVLVPGPSGVALLGLAGLAVRRRRRA